MIISAEELCSLAEKRPAYDTVIAGGGTVALLVAQELARHGQAVCVVEAGDIIPSAPEGAFRAKSIGRPHAGTEVGRAAGLGGTSSLWGGQLAMFAPDDLFKNGHEWPITYDELLPWYSAASAALGMPSPSPTDAYLNALGLTGNSDDELEPFFTTWLPEPNLARLFGRVIKTGRIDVIVGATAHGFRFHGARAEGLRVATRTNKKFVILAKNFVLAAGTIGNVQVMLSSIRHSKVPWSENRFVGEYFQDHLGGKAASVRIIEDSRFRQHFENGVSLGVKFQPKLRLKVRPSNQASVCGYFSFRSSLAENLSSLKRLLRNVRAGVGYSDLIGLPLASLSFGRALLPIALHYIHKRRVFALYDQGVDLLIQSEQWPIRNSRILATGTEVGPEGLLRVAVDWKVDGREAAAIQQFVSRAAVYLKRNRLAEIDPEPWVTAGSEGLTTAIDTFHQSGGLRMGGSPDAGVVDRNATVFGTANVSVAGASVLPSSSYANCTFTSMALALRLAGHILRRDKAPS